MVWDYSLSDLVMFTPEVYLRLFVRFNEAVWPLQIIALGAGLAIPFLLMRPSVLARKLAVVLMSLGWIFTGLGFMQEYYAPINWPVSYFAYAFVAQALLLAAVAGVWQPPAAMTSVQGFCRGLLVLWGLVLGVLPWLTVAAGGEPEALALAGLTPDITATASMLVTALLPRAWRWPVVLVPLGWCLFSLLTLYTLELFVAMLAPLVGVILAVVTVAMPNPGRVRH